MATNICIGMIFIYLQNRVSLQALEQVCALDFITIIVREHSCHQA